MNDIYSLHCTYKITRFAYMESIHYLYASQVLIITHLSKAPLVVYRVNYPQAVHDILSPCVMAKLISSVWYKPVMQYPLRGLVIHYSGSAPL